MGSNYQILAWTALIALTAGTTFTLLLRRLFDIRPKGQEGARKSLRDSARDLGDKFTRFIQDLLPATRESSETQRDQLARSGMRIGTQVMWSARVGCVIAGALIGIIVFPVFGGPRGAAALGLCLVLGLIAPQVWLMAKRRAWRDEIDRQLPDALDLLVICVSAGQSFDSALRTVSVRMEGALADGFKQVVDEAAYSSRSEALLRFSDRAEVSSLTIFVASLVQAERTGARIVDILREQAASVRRGRRLKVEEKANQLAAKMLIPMILFIFPTLVIMMLAPVVPLILEALS